jgi:hypothetical protein
VRTRVQENGIEGGKLRVKENGIEWDRRARQNEAKGIIEQSIRVSRQSSELGTPPPHPLPCKQACRPPADPKGWGEQQSLGCDGGGTQFGRLDRKPGNLCTLWNEVNSEIDE